MKTTAKQRVHAALKTGPKTTAELMEAGGRNFPARLEELRREGIDHTTKRLTQSSYLFTLVGDGVASNARTPLKLVESKRFAWPGPFKACLACSYTWDVPGSADACPRCEAGAHWLVEHTDRTDRDRAAALIDPSKVAGERAYWARVLAERDRRPVAA